MHRRCHQEVRWQDPASTSGSAGVEASRTTRASISSMARMIRSRGSAAHRRNCSRREPSRVVTLQSTASSLRSAFRIVFQLHLQMFDIDTVPRTSGSVSAGSRQDRNQADITRSGWFGQRAARFFHEGRKVRAQTNRRAFPDRARRIAGAHSRASSSRVRGTGRRALPRIWWTFKMRSNHFTA